MAEQKDAHETRDATQPLTTDEAAPRIRWRKRGEGTRVEEGDPALSSEADAAGQGQESAHGENMADLQGRLAAEHARAEDALGKLARTQADFANYKRRSEQEREQQARFATQLLVQEMLPVLDNLDRLLATMPDAVKGLPWAEGLVLVDRHLRGTLEKQGLKPIEAVGARFDPMLHEAIIHEDSDEYADDEVTAELRRGYVLHDKVVRPTLVKVARHTGAKQQTPGER